MADSTTITVGLSGALALVSCSSAFILSLQRTHLHKSQHVDPAPLKFDTKRDLTVPTADDSNRLTRLTLGTLILASLSALNFYQAVERKNEEWLVSASLCAQFVSWLYAFVLVLVSRRHRFPSEWGWILNVHLCIFYCMAWCIAFYNLYDAYVVNPNATWLRMLPTILAILLGTDLVYTTATVPRGAPFVDDNGKQVAAINVASIFSFLYFSWVNPLIRLAYKKKKLSDEDLPSLPPLFRGRNLYYIFGATRGKSLLKRIYLANKKAIIIQVILAIVSSLAYYIPAYFVNRLLVLIQSMNGKEDDVSIRRGFVIVASLGATIFILGLVVGQLWYYASSSVQVRVKAMLNIEIYRKTLRRRDLAVDSPKIDDTDENKKSDAKDGKKEKPEGKEDVSSTTGTIVNLMSTDSNRISEFSVWWFSILAAPTELAIGIYFLYTLLGNSCFLGLLVMIIVLPLNHYNAKMFARTQDKLMEARDKRVNLMNEVLQGIRQIKFFAWEKNWEKRIMEARQVELHQLGMTYLSGVLFTFLWQGSPILVTLISFWSFTVLEGRELTAPIAFTAITVFNELRFALNILPEVFIEWLQALISIRRIQTYLDEDEVDPPNDEDDITDMDDAITSNKTIKIGFENATVGWSKQNYTDEVSDENDNITTAASSSSFILKDLNAHFPNNELSLISGSTGSGKTLMMLSLLGEAIVLKGTAHCPRQTVADTVSDDFAVSKDIDPKDWILPYALAYVSQTAWLQNASIRDNILFGLPYVESRYRETLSACALDKDLDIFEDGDQTEIGEKGITLSGGQKARVSLARAVYSRAQNVLLDDILSALDAHTAKHVYEKCLLGPLMRDRTRILITHYVKLCIKGSAYIVHIDAGRANLVGTPNELRQSGQLTSIFESEAEEIGDIEEDAEEEKAIEETIPAADGVNNQKKPRALVEEESRATGMVKLRLYKMYTNMVGNLFFWFVMVVLILGSRTLDVTENWWIKQWSHSYEPVRNDTVVFQQQSIISQSKPLYAYQPLSPIQEEGNEFVTMEGSTKDDTLNYYLGIYCLITMTNIVIGTARFAVLYWGVLGANKKLYAELLHRVFRAPLRFFDTTPIGRILNRFSKDFETIDSNIPNDLLSFIIQWVIVISSMLTVSTVLPIFLIPMLIVAGINIYMGAMFVSTSRELKRMDSVSRSPLFSNFTETIVGVATIRAFGATRQFLQDMLNYIDTNARPYYYTWLVNRHISVRFAFTGAAINFITGIIILLSVDKMTASLAGFCLSFVLLFTDQMFWGIRRYTSLEMSMNAVERVVEFMEMDQEAPAITQLRPPADWPAKGRIEVTDLEIKYAAELDPVLKGISFSIKPQEKIGVVGRTGSGKSTLALSFFRFVEASRGSIVIDGIDIKDLGTEDLRSNLTIIPQDPTLFSGSLRSNMDPFDQFQDEDIFTALRRVHLLPTIDGEASTTHTSTSDSTLDEVNANVFKDLETSVTEGGKNFSQGQRQLLCLARALLKRSRIVLMDEATASVDFETDKAIQKTIATEFADSTILCIAHRLHTVIEYDRILVLDQGEIAEFDSPLTLINNPESAFYKMCRNSGEFDSLVALAKSKHELVDVSTSA